MLLVTQLVRSFAMGERSYVAAHADSCPIARVLQLLAPAAAEGAPLSYAALVRVSDSHASNPSDIFEPAPTRLRVRTNHRLSDSVRAV